MNWMGGARSRIKQHGDRKIQKQFFERKRLKKRNENLNPGLQTPLERKSAISQDIKAFCLLEQMHSKDMLSPEENIRPVRKIELAMPKTSRLIHHSNLGSSPPFNTPSKLLLMEPKHQRDISWKVISDRKQTTSSDQMSTKLDGETESNVDFGICSKRNSSVHKNSKFQQENPYILEDFQPTPVIQYLKDGYDNCIEKPRKQRKSTELFAPTWTPVSVKQNAYIHKDDMPHKNKDFYHKFCQNPFFETPVEHKESKRRKLEVKENSAQQEAKPALFDDSKILNQCFLEQNKGHIKYHGSSPVLKGSHILDTPDSNFLDSRSHKNVNGLQTSALKKVPRGRKKENLNNMNFENSLEKPLDERIKPSLSSANFQRNFKTPSISDQMKQEWYTENTPGNLITTNARNSEYTKRHINFNSGSLYEYFANSCEVNKLNIYSRDEMSLLMTSTPVDIKRKPMEILISPISHTMKKSPPYNVTGFHTNHSISEETVSNTDKHDSDHTIELDKAGDRETCDNDQSFIEKSSNHSETEVAEILAEMDQLEEDQAKDWELSVYCTQTQSEKDNEEQYIELKKLNDIDDSLESYAQKTEKIGKLEDFVENKYDALVVLKAAAAKLEKYVEHNEVTENGAHQHKENDISIGSKQNQTQRAEKQLSLPKLQRNDKEQNPLKQLSEEYDVSVRNTFTTAIEEKTGNACIYCCSTDIRENVSLQDSGENGITLRTAPQITDNTESCHQMSSPCINDRKCKCSDLFVLRSSKESQTEIYVRSIGIETDAINAVSVGIQCDLFLDGCDCKLEAPEESQDSFHSVASDLHFEDTDQNDVKQSYHLRSRKKIYS